MSSSSSSKRKSKKRKKEKKKEKKKAGGEGGGALQANGVNEKLAKSIDVDLRRQWKNAVKKNIIISLCRCCRSSTAAVVPRLCEKRLNVSARFPLESLWHCVQLAAGWYN